MFDIFTSRVTLNGTLTAKTALRIGAGRATGVSDTDLPVVRNAVGDPYIPGSSLKGALRAHVEALIRGILSDDRKAACNPLNDKEWCVTDKEIKAWQRELKDDDKKLSHRVEAKTCLVCGVFGSPWIASKVNIRDLPVTESTWIGQYETRNGVAIDRDTETASASMLYDFEAVPAGTTFDCRIVVENAEKWQLGLLMAALQPFSRGEGALGGARSRGLGVAEITWGKRECVGNGDLLKWLVDQTGTDVTESDTQDWLKAFAGHLRTLKEAGNA